MKCPKCSTRMEIFTHQDEKRRETYWLCLKGDCRHRIVVSVEKWVEPAGDLLAGEGS